MLRYTAADLPEGSPAPVQTIDVDAGEARYHLDLQWSQHRYTGEAATDDVQPHEELKLCVRRIAGLETLSSEPGVLEMSDLKSIYLGDDGGLIHADAGESTPSTPVAYPFASVTPSTNLGLYFEVYQLMLGADDQVHFTVEYEVERNAGRGKNKQTSASTSYSGDSRRAQESIALDLSEYGEQGSLAIRVTVTDDISKQTVTRVIQFDLAEALEAR
jgi:hypothetical protein